MPCLISAHEGGVREMRHHSRHSGGKLFSQNYDEICKKCLSEGKLFEDPCFPADDSSLFYNTRPEHDVYWKRPHEICRAAPVWIKDGFSRFDVVQGELGDCWLLAAIGSLTCNPQLLQRVVPPHQTFDKKNGYCGVFRFRLWYQGDWVEVVVDDRLPTFDPDYPQLLYLHSQTKAEFWSALLEKAYAKLYGCYECLQGGNAVESLEDLTGGLGETIHFRPETEVGLCTPVDRHHEYLKEVLIKTLERGGLLTCSKNPQNDEIVDTRRSVEGILFNHAYSVTKATEVNLSDGTSEFLVRVRNPWGDGQEWRGDWSDHSPKWSLVPPKLKRQISVTIKEDGEFWMSLSDFIAYFTKIDLCNLDPLYIEGTAVDTQMKWNVVSYHKAWIKYVNAGGCINYIESIWKNPQFRVQLEIPDQPNGSCTMIVALMQKDRRRLLRERQTFLNIGYVIYKLHPGYENRPLDRNYFLKYPPDGKKGFINTREVCHRHRLPVGNYVIIPSTFEPEQEAHFLLRIFTEKPKTSRQMDEETRYMIDTVDSRDCVDGPNVELDEFVSKLEKDANINAYNLMDILQKALITDFPFTGFQIETCRSMVAMKDTELTGTQDWDQFKSLCQDILLWKAAFGESDPDKCGHISSYSLRPTLNNLGYHVSNSTLQALVLRHVNKDGNIEFGDFIRCLVKLKTTLDTLERADIKDVENILPALLYS